MNEATVERAKFDFQNVVWFSFLALVFSLGFVQPFVYYQNLRFSPTDFIFLLVCVFLLAALLLKKTVFRWHKFYWLLLFYFVVMCVSSVFSINPKQSCIKLLGEAYLLGLVVLMFNFVRTKEQFRQTISVWLAATAVSLAVGILTIFLFYVQPENTLLAYTNYHFGAVPVGNYPRPASTFASASMFCNFLNVGLIMLFIAEKFNYINRKLFLILLILLGICAVFTISSGIGGIVLAIGVWIWAKNSGGRMFSKFALFGAVFIAVAFFVLNFFALQKYPNAPFTVKMPFFNIELQPSPRFLVWTDALETFLENPLTGIGLGQNTSQVSFQNTDGTLAYLTDAHNIFLSVAAQNGVFGLLAIALIIFFIIKKFEFSTLKKNNFAFAKNWLVAAFTCAFVYQGLTGSFEDTRHLWALIGLVLSAESLEKTET